MPESSDIERLYSERIDKAGAVDRLKSSPADFEASLEIAVTGTTPDSWRAAFVVFHAMEPADPRLQARVGDIVGAVPGRSDSHQRELLRILLELDIPDEHEGMLFDASMHIWENLQHSSGLRLFAFRHICRIVEKYPGLKGDVRFVIQNEYLDPLSPGIRRCVHRMIGEMRLQDRWAGDCRDEVWAELAGRNGQTHRTLDGCGQSQVWPFSAVADIEAALGNTELALAYIDSTRVFRGEDRMRLTDWWTGIGKSYLKLGMHDTVMDLLEADANSEAGWVDEFELMLPFWDEVRDHPRFKALEARVAGD